MPSFLTSVFRSVTNRPNQGIIRGLPLINELTDSFTHFLSIQGQASKKKALMAWFRRTPELTAFVNKVSRDMTSRGHFETVKPEDSGRNKLLTANKFLLSSKVLQIREAQIADALVTGDAFGWKGKLLDKQVKETINSILGRARFADKNIKSEVARRLIIEMKQEEGIADVQDIDEDLLRPRKYRYVPSTTVEVVHDKVDIIQYNHIVGVNPPIVFKPDEMIHFTLSKRDGKVNGFTPVESVIVQLELLRQMWQNMLSVYKNGGSPDKVFIIKNKQVNSQDYKRIEQQLQKYKLVENKHGNMIFTGDIEIQDLQQMDQMQFKDMGLYITGLIAMQWGIPRSSIPYIIGGTNTKDDTGGNSERGYWEAVSHMQRAFFEDENIQLWMPHFGVKWIPENSYMNLDIQRETALQLKLNNMIAMDTLLNKSDKQLSQNKRLNLLGITDKDTEKMKEEELPMGSTLNNQLSKDEVNKSDDKKNADKKKKDEQTSTIASQGVKPNGVSKEFQKLKDPESDVEYKLVSFRDASEIPLSMFIKIYNEDKTYHPGKPPRVFLQFTEDLVSLRFKSSDFVYLTVLSKEEFELNTTLMMNINRRDIYIV